MLPWAPRLPHEANSLTPAQVTSKMVADFTWSSHVRLPMDGIRPCGAETLKQHSPANRQPAARTAKHAGLWGLGFVEARLWHGDAVAEVHIRVREQLVPKRLFCHPPHLQMKGVDACC